MNGHILLLAMMAAALPLKAAVITESFTANPLERGWQVLGDASLFQWNATNENLEVTWDSARTNSYFLRPLGNVLSTNDDFSLGFDLRLSDIAIGTSDGKPYTFQIAVGLLNQSSATASNYFRGAGQSAVGPRNLVEFNYFPDSGFGATVAITVASTNNRIAYSHNYPLEMTTGDLFRVVMNYTASNQILRTSVTRNGAPFGLPPDNALEELSLEGHPDFRVDALAVMSYSDAVQVGPPQFWGSVRAHGTVDNISMTLPDAVANFTGVLTNGTWRAEFAGRLGWEYSLERTTDFVEWSSVAGPASGAGAVVLIDPAAPADGAYYRVRAHKP